jgi:energy-coupling factor transport system ATP-binding protein
MTIELRAVTYRYPGYRRPAIDGMHLRVDAGEIVGIVGPNEAGKSTLCLVASGLAPASTRGELSGDVLIDGTSLRGLPIHALPERVGIAFSNPASQLSGLAGTVFEEVAIGPINLGFEVSETVVRVEAALRGVGIEDLAARRPDHLSGGQSQLVAIASLLAMRPRNLVLDEPVAELDPDGRSLVAAALRAIAAQGTAILIAEHDLDLLRAIGARIVPIADGRLGS